MVVSFDTNNIIGEGAHASIVNGFDNKKPIAIKLFNFSSDISKQAYDREIMVNKFINHKTNRFCKNIKYYSDIEYGYLCMKKYDCDLFEYSFERNNNLSLNSIIKIFKKICKSVEILHKKNIAHLDIKPENILVDFKGKKFVLTDFGCCYIGNYNESINFPCGSPNYFPYHDKNYDPFKIDIYSLGVTLHVLLTKTFPTFNKISKKWDIQDINLSNPSIKLLQSMLSSNINERPNISDVLKSSFFKQKIQNSYKIIFSRTI